MRTLVRLVATVAASWAGYSAAGIAQLTWLSGHGVLLNLSDRQLEVVGHAAGTALAVLVWCSLRAWTKAPSVPVTPRLRPPSGPWVVPEHRPRRVRPYTPALSQDIALLHSVALAEDGR